MSATTLTNESLAYELPVVAEAVVTPASAVDNVSKLYPVPFRRIRQAVRRQCLHAVEALQDISFNVRESEIFGVIGPNGAGKTTLTKIIATLVQPTSGTVTVRGWDSVFDEDKVHVQVGLASADERSFYWRLTVKQNLLFFALLYGMSDKTAMSRITDLLGLFLTALVLHSIGILSASFTLVFQRGDPFGATLATGSFLLSGVLFPTQALSGTFHGISCALPTTYGLDGVRRVLIEGQSWSQVQNILSILMLFLIGLLPFSLVVFSGALGRAKRDGSLVQY